MKKTGFFEFLKKHIYKILFVCSLILAFGLGTLTMFGYLDVARYTTPYKPFGTFGINTDNPASRYIAILDEDSCVWYDQHDFLMIGTFTNLDSNVYSFVFEDQQYYGVYYEDELLLIGDNQAVLYPRASRVILLVNTEGRFDMDEYR